MIVVLVSVLAMLCKSVVDLLGNKVIKNSKGNIADTYYFIQTATMVFLWIILLAIDIIHLQFSMTNIIFGIFIGALSYVSYLFFVYSLKGESGSVYITIYRLNFIISSIIGIFVFSEKITIGKILGGVFCLIAIAMFVDRDDLLRGKIDKYLVYAILASLFVGIMNIFNKYALNAGASSNDLLAFRYFFVLLFTITDYRIRKIKIRLDKEHFPLKFLAYSITSGAVLLISLYLFFYALKIGDITVVTPIVQSCFIFSSAFCIIFFKEKYNARKLAGMFFAILCIVFIGI